MAAVAAAGAGRNVPKRSWMHALSSRAQRGQAEPSELQPRACREVRESNIPLELCVYTARRKGEKARGVHEGHTGRETNQLQAALHKPCAVWRPATVQQDLSTYSFSA